jgi:hypothetical protein
VLAAEDAYFFCLCLATIIHNNHVNISGFEVLPKPTSHGGQYMIMATPTKLTLTPITSIISLGAVLNPQKEQMQPFTLLNFRGIHARPRFHKIATEHAPRFVNVQTSFSHEAKWFTVPVAAKPTCKFVCITILQVPKPFAITMAMLQKQTVSFRSTNSRHLAFKKAPVSTA